MKEFIDSFRYAFRGMAVATRDRNIRIHGIIATMVIIASFYFQITSVEWLFVVIAITLVIGLEMINSAIENLVDLVTRERHPLAGKVKDIAAGAVLFAALMSVVIGTIVFWKYVVSLAP